MKPKVLLYEHVGLALIVAFPSGVTYSNQAGGTSCLQPELEGILVPLRNDCLVEGEQLLSPAMSLEDYFTGEKWGGTGATHGIDNEDADFIDTLLQTHRLSHCIQVDRPRLHESCEAWIHVEIVADENPEIPLFSGFAPYPRLGVLTWSNSD
ncbi:DUF6210 family protein [Haloferula sp. BvORR071]|uniref:DUF6210 family protein n=1 Tax=Haloferula sp. BvORR071 TaxID=1396141 RepID=UPI0005582D29|nr:DUF6210 family protein [Haloferula sp. BvORR071]